MSDIKEIPYGWVETTFGTLANTNQNSINKNYEFDEIEYLDTGSITEGQIDSLQKYGISDAPSRAKRLVMEDDIVYSTVRPNQKHYGFINSPVDNMVVSTGFAVISTNKNNYSKFLYYWLTQNSITDYLHQLAEQSASAYPSIKPMDIEKLKIYKPINKEEQKAIANILTAFDDKIENLRAQNETLEILAHTIFKEWFGKYQVGDLLPEGWRMGKLGEVTKISGGTTPSTKNPLFWDGDIPWTSPKDLSISKGLFLLSTDKKITKAGLKKISSGLLPKRTLLLSSRAPVGYLSLTNVELAINQGYIALHPNQYFSNNFMYLWLDKYMKVVENAANGSTFLEISKSSFRNIDCIIPEENILIEFDDFIKPTFDKILSNLLQIQTLTKTRNAVLPRLMSGNIRVNNVNS